MRTVDLLHPAASGQVAQVDHQQAGVVEHVGHWGLRRVVVGQKEDHALASGLLRI
jgi:hypothetical protein